MSVHENDFFPDLDVADAYRAQRAATDDQRRVLALERRVLELELARINEGRLAALEARLDGQGRDGTE